MSASSYDDVDAGVLAEQLDVPRVIAYARVSSTQDVAHRVAAEGAQAGTLVLAETQSAGRGRNGRSWVSGAGDGIWLTLIERPLVQSAADRAALDVLSLRVGLEIAAALDSFSDVPVRLKWPNDLYRHDRKLGGILVEARWRETRLEWMAIGVGINVADPVAYSAGIGLPAGTTRLAVLRAVVPAIRRAAASRGTLDDAELARFAQRDWAAGKLCTEPVRGTVRGISATGELVIDNERGIHRVRSGSLVLEE